MYGFQFFNQQGVPLFNENDRFFMLHGIYNVQVPSNNINLLTTGGGFLAPTNNSLPSSIAGRDVMIFAPQYSDLSVSINTFLNSNNQLMYQPVFCGNSAAYSGVNIPFAVYTALNANEINTTSGYGIAVFRGNGQPLYSTNHSSLQIIDSLFYTTSRQERVAGGETQMINRGVLEDFPRTNNMSRWWSVPILDLTMDSEFLKQEDVFALSFILVQPNRFRRYFVFYDQQSSQNTFIFERRTFQIASIAPFPT